jgi:hypothetical protein
MEKKVILITVMDYLNKIGSKVFIERFDQQSGIIFLSNQVECHIINLVEPEDIEG